MQSKFINRLPSQPITSQFPPKSIGKNTTPAKSFAETLKESFEGKSLTISKHADTRLKQRGIEISSETWREVESKVAQAKTKGVKESLVILENAALIVSAKNSTVITAMDRKEAGSQIFTNIDGTIIIDQ
ncbi:flagellar protein [Rossellomorea vietnamensis]|uniref:Flagellar protein n=1 Tax=Rossellomorea vietnamensis TaxID=218284 RepID=A0A5D4MF67_9BACI|nr:MULTISPECIES: TIGR02530 family flagellar biosynthesis protein [Bacillaceae]TYS00138.1 flagellar protein [Rossellomorea vietnamensis]